MSRDPDVLNKLERPTALGDNNNTTKIRLITDGGPDTDIEILTIPINKADDKFLVSNYRPVSILPVFRMYSKS